MSEDDLNEPQAEMELVMPFVVCASLGGPYEDAAFVAGCTLTSVMTRLEVGRPDTMSIYVPPALIPQLDLVAMKYGYFLRHEPWGEAPDEHTLAVFSLTEDEPTDA